MILSKIWQRYIFTELLKIFFLFLVSFFFLYAVIDYSTHIQDFIKNKKIQGIDVAYYYFYQFIKRANLLLPLALLIGTIKTLMGFNSSRELLAFQASGIQIKHIFRPFFLLAWVCVLFNFANEEWLLPNSLNYLDRFQKTHFRTSRIDKRKDPFFVLHLQDNSKLVYQEYNSETNKFFDVFWIRSIDDIWRIKFLTATQEAAQGEYVDHLVRNQEGFLEKSESFDHHLIPELKWQPNLPKNRKNPIENKKVSELYRLHNSSLGDYQSEEISTQLYFKLLLPILPLLVVIGIAPYCVNYNRSHPTFLLYTVGIFGFIALFTLLDAAVILSENQKFPPLIAIGSPLLICFFIFGWKYRTLK